MKKCGISSCATTDNRFLWTCQGTCKRHFHAACVGVQRHQEELLRTFMLPLCIECQQEFTDQLDLKKLIQQQQILTEDIKAQIKSTHALMHKFKDMALAHETLVALEVTLTELHSDVQIINSTANCTASNTAAKLNQIASHCEGLAADALFAGITEIKQAIQQTKNHNTEPLDKNFLEIAFNEFISPLNAKMTESFSRIEDKLSNKLNDVLATNTSSVSANTEILDEIKALAARTPKASLAEEFIQIEELNETTNIENSEPTPGWRIIGSKKIWKRDWSKYDAKQRIRRLQEKNADKARRKRRRHNSNSNKNNSNNNNRRYDNSNRTNICSRSNLSNNNSTNNSSTSPSTSTTRRTLTSNNYNNNNNYNHHNYDYNNNNNNNPHTNYINSNSSSHIINDKNLLDIAKIQFAGPPLTTVHPIAELSVPSTSQQRINFQQGETINPYRTKKTSTIEPCSSKSNPVPNIKNPDSQFELDPMRPPVVRLTEQSAEGDQRYLKARLRDPKIMHVVRLFLAYMKDQPPNVCIEGMTPTSIRMLLKSEGLPTNPAHLERIFIDVHEEYGLNSKEARDDLTSYHHFVASERTCRLQRLRESTNNFYSPNFRK